MQKRVMIILIVVLLVVLAAAVGIGAFFFIRNSNAENALEVEPVVTVIHLAENEIFDIDLSTPIRTNLAKSVDGSDHAISIDLSIGINNTVKNESEKVIALVTDKERVVRNIALNVIRRKTIQELERPDGMEVLQDDILAKLREQFNSNLIVRVIGFDMILQ